MIAMNPLHTDSATNPPPSPHSTMGKRKPIISLAAAMHRVTPTAMQAPTATASAASSAPGAADVPLVSGGNKKRKRGVLISAFHVLMREQDALASQKASLGAAAYAARHAELQSKLDALGGLESYQQLSIAGHSNNKHHAFNTSHWVIDVLASYPQFANLKKYSGAHPRSGGSEASAIAAAAGAGAASASAADEKRLAKRQKERERKRAKKRARKAAEEEEAAAAAAAAAKAAKGSKKKGAAAAAAAAAAVAASKKKPQPVDDDAEDSADEAQQADDHNASGSDGEEEEGDAGSAAAAAAAGPVFSAAHRIRLLDVGALTNHYLPYSSEIDCTAIDLHPQHPSVQAVDFFDLDCDSPAYKRAFDVVVLSLVINFVGDRFRRGDMIKRSVRMLRPEGHGRLFVILPSACLRNSRWMDHDSFVQRCMAPLGLQLLKWKYSTKLAMFEFRRVAVDPEEEAREQAERAAEAAAEQMEDEAAPSEEDDDDAADDGDDADGSKKFARAQAKAAAKLTAQKKAAAASKKKKRKGFQPAGIVLAGETRNNFSIAWKAD